MERKTTTIWVRCTDAEKRQIEQAADMYDMTVSQFVLAFTDYVRDVRPQLIIVPRKESENGGHA